MPAPIRARLALALDEGPRRRRGLPSPSDVVGLQTGEGPAQAEVEVGCRAEGVPPNIWV
jgi:hypothetical protein